MTRLSAFLLGIFKRNYPFFCTIFAISNFVLSCSCWKSVSPRHFYHTVSNEVFTTCVVTQYLESTSFSSNSVTSSPSQSVRNSEYPCDDYLYFLADGFPCVRLWGRTYYVGSRTSRGVIADIFPDRVLLVGGDSITNNDWRNKHDRFSTHDVAGSDAKTVR